MTTERPTLTIDAQAAGTLVHYFNAGLAETLAPHMDCEEVNALAALMLEVGAGQRQVDVWVMEHESNGDCKGNAHPCSGCGADAGEDCTPLSMCGAS